jgi:hypothetical protein
MKYILTTKNGTVRMFFVKEVAMMYRELFGGTVTRDLGARFVAN